MQHSFRHRDAHKGTPKNFTSSPAMRQPRLRPPTRQWPPPRLRTQRSGRHPAGSTFAQSRTHPSLRQASVGGGAVGYPIHAQQPQRTEAPAPATRAERCVDSGWPGAMHPRTVLLTPPQHQSPNPLTPLAELLVDGEATRAAGVPCICHPAGAGLGAAVSEGGAGGTAPAMQQARARQQVFRQAEERRGGG